MTRFAPSLVVLLVVLLAGCATVPVPPAPVATSVPAPSAPVSTPPVIAPAPAAVPVMEAKPATLIGSEESSLMFDSFTAYVAAVDGHPVPAGRAGWNTPLSLPAGPHRLTVEFNRGVFAARAELTLTAVPAATYELKFATDAEVFGRNSYCEFWIVETTAGELATQRARTALTKVSPPR